MDMNDPTNKAIDNALDKYLSPIVYVAIGLGLITFILVNYWVTILILLAVIVVGYFIVTRRDAIADAVASIPNALTNLSNVFTPAETPISQQRAEQGSQPTQTPSSAAEQTSQSPVPTQRDTSAGALGRFFAWLANPTGAEPVPPPRPPDDYANMLGKALQISLEQEGRPLPPNEVFDLAIRVGHKLVCERTYDPPDEFDRSYSYQTYLKELEQHEDFNRVRKALGQEPSPYAPRFIGPLELEAMKEKYPRIAIIAGDAVFESLQAYMKNFPVVEDGPFLAPVITKINFPHVIYEMLKPLRENQILISFNLLQFLHKRFDENVRALPPVGKDLMWPQNFDGPQEKIAEVYLKDHPFLPLFQVLVPFQPFTEQNRCAHHWCLGKTGRGKTTFLRHLIKHDLESVEKGKCSLVVIDSKKLIREMRTLQQFAFELEGRLTLIDSDEPFPLNPFTLPRQQARPIIMYMLAEMTFASGLQTGALTYLVDAALQSKKPSLRTMRDFFALDLRKGQMPADYEDFDQDTQHWFQHTFKELPPATRSGIHQRLANFLKEHEFGLARMFDADSFGLDIAELDQGGRVWLVDTDLNQNGADGTNLLGRLIIALLEQLVTRRNKEDESRLTPVWCYIDEASDYLKESDPKFVQILTKARSSKVGMTVAYQYKGLVGADVERALENAEIHSECVQRGSVGLTVQEQRSTLTVGKLEFDGESQMARDDYRQVREGLRLRYPYTTAGTPPTVTDQPLTQKF